MKTRLFLSALILGLLAQPSWSQGLPLDEIRADLAKIDVRIQGQAEANAPMPTGGVIKPRDVYHAYLARAEKISGQLLSVKERLERHGNTMSLQQLGALSQELTASNRRFEDTFKYGEEQFQSYRLIQKAIHSLEDAIRYWRLCNEYRAMYRGSALEKANDDEVLQIKLQTAITAIDELKAIREMRQALETLNEDYYP